MPVLAAGERQLDQVIAFGAGRRGTLYLTDRRLIFEWGEGLVAKKFQQLSVALSDIQAVNAVHSTLRGREIVVTARDTSNGFHTNRITLAIAMTPEVWMGKINNLLNSRIPQTPQPSVVIQREVVKTPCRYCGTLLDAFRVNKCPNCGAPLS